METVVEALSVREHPGTDAERYGFLALGTVGVVFAGPTDVNGVPWYWISGIGLPWASGCVTQPPDQPMGCPAYHGWVAGANEAGDPWLGAIAPPDCPHPTVASISESGFTLRLICWRDAPLVLEAWWPVIPAGAGLGGVCPEIDMPGGWLFCQGVNYNVVAASSNEPWGSLPISIDPQSGLTMPERGQWIRVTGGFDHPDAAHCADFAPTDDDPLGFEFRCRLEFVPTAIEPLGGSPS